MGKKGKVGKQRKDRFYHLAKETGYRSRAAFKLIQLNRKFEFLQKSRVAIDLCAAPGGWLQVCSKFMPVSSVIVGVDLVHITPIPNVITLMNDITTTECRAALRKELKTWKADLVLNDGAPNVGKSWIHDAFQQNRLTLSALQLASEFLMKGGTFVTKVFRSKDYNALIWVLGKLFKKVAATKPAASRNESAEIFIVAQNYLAPEKIDPKFFNPSYLFDDAENEEAAEKKRKVNLLKPAGKLTKAKAEGYKEGDVTQFTSIKVSKFIREGNHLNTLSQASELTMDDIEVTNHKDTTTEILECCKDIKVLGRKEILTLIKWRRKLRSDLGIDNKDVDAPPKVDDIEEEPMDEEAEADKKMRKKKKKIQKERRKLNEKMNLQMVIKNDQLIDEGDHEMFSLKRLKKNMDLKDFEEFVLSDHEGDVDDDGPDDQPSRFMSYDKDHRIRGDSEDDSAPEEGDDDHDDDYNEGIKKRASRDTLDSDDDNDLLEDLGTKLTRKDKADMFFKKEAFQSMGNITGFDDDDPMDEDEQLMETLAYLDPRTNRRNKNKKKQGHPMDSDGEEKGSPDGYHSSSEDDDVLEPEKPKKKHPSLQNDLKLDAESSALAEQMIYSSKVKRDMFDDGWNRYTRGGDDDAPRWFRDDEDQHWKKTHDVDPDVLKKYQDRTKQMNVRTIKRVVEAKARKKKRATNTMDRARKKAETITDAPDMSEKEKSSHLRSLYKKASKTKKQEVKYVVAKKGARNQRPAGHKGKYKVVDARLKKDMRNKNMTQKGGKKGTKRPPSGRAGSGGGGGRGGRGGGGGGGRGGSRASKGRR